MKIQTLITQIDAELESAKHVSRREWHKRFSEYAAKKVRETLRQRMGDNLDKELNLEDVAILLPLYKDLRAVVEGTNYVPNISSNSSLTALFKMMAEQISTVDPSQNYYQLLYPKLTRLNYDLLRRDLADKDEPQLEPQECILSDNEDTLIDVVACLANVAANGSERGFAQQYTLPNPNYIPDLDRPATEQAHSELGSRLTIQLTESERERVINHSVHTQNYWAAIQDAERVKKSTPVGETYYSKIAQLAEKLKAGNYARPLPPGLTQEQLAAAQLQADLQAGEEALEGTREFCQWYFSLPLEERARIDNAQSPQYGKLGGETYTFCDMAQTPIPTEENYYGRGVRECPAKDRLYLAKDGSYRTSIMGETRNLFADLRGDKLKEQISEYSLSDDAYRKKFKDQLVKKLARLSVAMKNINVEELQQKLNNLPQTLDDPLLRAAVLKIGSFYRKCSMTPLKILSDPTIEREESDTATCVDLLSTYIGDILENSPQLKNMNIKEDAAATQARREKLVTEVEEKAANAGVALQAAMADSKNYSVARTADENQDLFATMVQTLPDLETYSPGPLTYNEQNTLNTLGPYGLTEAHLRSLSRPDDNLAYRRRQALSVLIAGSANIYYGYVKPNTCLTAEAAIAEVQGLNAYQCDALNFYYKHGLRAAQLRTCPQFSEGHLAACAYFLTQKQPALTPTELIDKIKDLSSADAMRLYIEDRTQREADRIESERRDAETRAKEVERMLADMAARRKEIEQREIERREAEQREVQQRMAAQRELEQRIAEQRAAERRLAEQRIAEQKEAVQKRAAEQREAAQKITEQKEREKREIKRKTNQNRALMASFIFFAVSLAIGAAVGVGAGLGLGLISGGVALVPVAIALFVAYRYHKAKELPPKVITPATVISKPEPHASHSNQLNKDPTIECSLRS